MPKNNKRKRDDEYELALKGTKKVCNDLYESAADKLTSIHNSSVMKDSTLLDDDVYLKLSKKYKKNKSNIVMQNMLCNLPCNILSESRNVLKQLDYTYSDTLKIKLNPTNQYHSGRCWIFAGLNAMRYKLVANLNIGRDFELSQAHLFYYDRIERCNYFLEKMIEFRNRDLNDELLYSFMTNAHPLSDGGTWTWFSDLVQKYGVMPQTNYDECFNTLCTDEMSKILINKLHEFTYDIRNMKRLSNDNIRKKKDDVMLPVMYDLVTKFMGEPPQTFDWKFNEHTPDSEEMGTAHRYYDLTPVQFYKQLVEPYFSVDTQVILVNDPRKESKYYQTYTVPHFSNMVGGKKSVTFNVPVDVMKKAATESIRDQQPMWFACDVDKFFNTDKDLLDVDAYDYEKTLGTEFKLSKGDRLKMRTSFPVHAMLLVGTDIQKDKYIKWRIENSWGISYGSPDLGHLQMSDKWFDEYLFAIVVDESYLDNDTLSKYRKMYDNPVELHFNDPFGAVAVR